MARTIYLVLAALFLAGLIIQVFLAGLGVFDSPASFATHRDWGYTLVLFPVLLLVVALVGRLGRRLIVLPIVAFLGFILQSVLVALRDTNPALAALHPVNGFLITLLAVVMVREAYVSRAVARTPDAPAVTAGAMAPTGTPPSDGGPAAPAG